MTEAREQTPVQGTRYEIARTIPRNDRGERIGTGVMLDKVGHGLFGEKVSSTVMKALARTGRIIEVSPDGAEQSENLSGARYDAGQTNNTEITGLLQSDEQQTASALKTTRSALQREIAAQDATARPKPQEKNDALNKLVEHNPRKEPETEIIVLRSLDGKRVLGSFTARKNATRAELNQAAQAAGLDYRISPVWTILHSIGIRG